MAKTPSFNFGANRKARPGRKAGGKARPGSKASRAKGGKNAWTSYAGGRSERIPD
jgi:hypothetical protein